MKLEDKFCKAFFYPFLIGVCLSTLVVILFLGFFTNNNLDKRTSQNIIDLERKYSEININSVDVLLTTSLLKVQASLNEQILFYQKISKEIIKSNVSYELESPNMKCALNIDKEYCKKNLDKTALMAVWLLDEQTTEENLDYSRIEAKNQLIAYSKIIPNLDSSFEVAKPNIISYYFYFEKNELYISYPLIIDCESGFISEMKNFTNKTFTCINDKGQIYEIYKMKCEVFFSNIQKSTTESFDNNYLANQNRTIFITNFYSQEDGNSEREFAMCIKFSDPITEGKAYACVDVFNEDMIFTLENLNSNLLGYFFISNIGFNNVFYFPQGPVSPKTSTENIFRWDLKFKFDEKMNYYRKVKKLISSNYIDNIENMFAEIYANNDNSRDQYFFLDGKKYKYSIYPIIMENLEGKKEHVFSIIYVYEEELYFEELGNYTSSLIINIILELTIFIVFGSVLLYIIYLTFNNLSKYIVIPIKNVNYMLKGINIGGQKRLEYLDYLKKKQDENLEKLEKMYQYESRKFLKRNESMNETESELENNYEKKLQDVNNLIKKYNSKNSTNEHINPYDGFNKKYDEESNYIQKEVSFYDFDDQLLQYRPLEIENLVKSLIDLKSALILTSSDKEVAEIIDYSCSEQIFRNFKNKEGVHICQSNIGNLQSQLLKFDKAIYHLALSLEDNKLKRFLNRNLNDEFDESDSLLKKISYFFNKEKKKEKINILAEKQMNNAKENFSQKTIGILINTRYSRLIYVYYKFFKCFKNLKKLKDDITNGNFMNTSFHTIDYYHKIIIQFIYLSYIKNDLVKIGESILDYIEFLIKFKFKTSSEDKYFLKFNGKNNLEYRNKLEFKKTIFNKIIKWFNLFDDYASYVKDNSSVSDIKNFLDDYSHNFNSENNDFNFESQSSLIFRINLQKCDFLKGKMSLYCKNYNDAIFYFIRASKKRSIIIDGLIKKRSLKHISKLLIKMKKKFEFFRLKNLYMEKELKEYKRENLKEKNKIIIRRNTNRKITEKLKDLNYITFGEEIEMIKIDILRDINKCNATKEKDIIILIDFNIYNMKQENNSLKTYKIDAFIEQTIVILNNYLSTYDRFCVIIYYNNHKIICPLMNVNKIDISNFEKDLIYYKNIALNENNEKDDYNIILDEFIIDRNNLSEQSQEDSFEISEKEESLIKKITGLVEAMNYTNDYIKMKEGVKNERYIILFTDMFNIKLNEDENIEKIEKNFANLKSEVGTTLLLVGKNKKINPKKENCIFNEKKIEELILTKYGEKSESINFENMKKIKTILSINYVIKDEIIYPNEIYK